MELAAGIIPYQLLNHAGCRLLCIFYVYASNAKEHCAEVERNSAWRSSSDLLASMLCILHSLTAYLPQLQKVTWMHPACHKIIAQHYSLNKNNGRYKLYCCLLLFTCFAG